MQGGNERWYAGTWYPPAWLQDDLDDELFDEYEYVEDEYEQGDHHRMMCCIVFVIGLLLILSFDGITTRFFQRAATALAEWTLENEVCVT